MTKAVLAALLACIASSTNLAAQMEQTTARRAGEGDGAARVPWVLSFRNGWIEAGTDSSHAEHRRGVSALAAPEESTARGSKIQTPIPTRKLHCRLRLHGAPFDRGTRRRPAQHR